jgi:plastocyanin
MRGRARRVLRLWLAFSTLGMAAIVALPGTAAATKIKGRVENYRQLANPVWDEARDSKRKLFTFRETVPTVPAQFRKMFPHIPKELCIAALAASPRPPPQTAVLIRVGGGRTTPVTIVVAPGTRLQFKNTDPFTHRLHALKDNVGVRTFVANDTIKGGTREWTVPEPGTFEVRDELAPSLRMWIVAEPSVVTIGYPSMKGEFALVVEPGEYTIQVFFSGKKVGDPRSVTVGGNDLDLGREPIKVAPDPKKSEKKDGEKAGEGDEAASKDDAKADQDKPGEKNK